MVRWYLDDDDDDDDDDYEEELRVHVLKPERLLHRTDRGAGWHHVQQLMHGNEQSSDNRCDQPRDMKTNNPTTIAAINCATWKRTTISDIKSQSLVGDSGR
ncbi:hypothetical protein Bca101_025698 [Brassica carinata]